MQIIVTYKRRPTIAKQSVAPLESMATSCSIDSSHNLFVETLLRQGWSFKLLTTFHTRIHPQLNDLTYPTLSPRHLTSFRSRR